MLIFFLCLFLLHKVYFIYQWFLKSVNSIIKGVNEDRKIFKVVG